MLSKTLVFLQRIKMPAWRWQLLTEHTPDTSMFTSVSWTKGWIPVVSKEKKRVLFPAQSEHTFYRLGQPSHWLSGLEKTHSCFSWVNNPRYKLKKKINKYVSLLSRGVNNTFLVYSGTFWTLQNQHKKPQPHLYSSMFYLGPHPPRNRRPVLTIYIDDTKTKANG